MKLQDLNLDLQELTLEEEQNINGGESAWYWIAYGIGSIGRGIAWLHDGLAQPPELIGVK